VSESGSKTETHPLVMPGGFWKILNCYPHCGIYWQQAASGHMRNIQCWTRNLEYASGMVKCKCTASP